MPESTPPSHEEMCAAVREYGDVLEAQLEHDFLGRVWAEERPALAHQLACLRAILAQLEASRWRPIAEAPKEPLVSHDKHRYGPRFIGAAGMACFICQWWETDIGGGGSNFLTDGGNVVHPTRFTPLPPLPPPPARGVRGRE